MTPARPRLNEPEYRVTIVDHSRRTTVIDHSRIATVKEAAA